jgi:hypothetical protein
VASRIKGLNRVKANLKKKPDAVKSALAAALNIEAEIIMSMAKALTPVDLGALRSSGHVKAPVFKRNKISVEIGFGGPAAPYAIFVHEDLTAAHPVGQAKFLEVPFKQQMSGLSNRIAKRLEESGVIG